jgi:membrane protein DedA with SNARE-associated domain
MSLLACIGLFAAVVATWIAISGPGEAALVSAGTVAARGEEGIAAVLVIAFLRTFAGNLGASTRSRPLHAQPRGCAKLIL